MKPTEQALAAWRDWARQKLDKSERVRLHREPRWPWYYVVDFGQYVTRTGGCLQSIRPRERFLKYGDALRCGLQAVDGDDFLIEEFG